MRKRYNKTFGTSEINSPKFPPFDEDIIYNLTNSYTSIIYGHIRSVSKFEPSSAVSEILTNKQTYYIIGC